MKTLLLSYLAVILGTATALADPPAAPAATPSGKVALTGAAARDLTLGLKLAGVPSKKTAGAAIYTASKIECSSMDGGNLEDGLDDTRCHTAATATMTSAQSAVLQTALTAALAAHGLEAQGHAGSSTITVATIACKILPDGKAAKTADRFSCGVSIN